MQLIIFLSNMLLPLTIFGILGYSLIQKQNSYEDFTDGAKEGLRIVWKILPTLIGLMTAVGVLRASGFLDMCAGICEKIFQPFHIPAQLFPLMIVKLFSSSAATGLLLDIYKNFGTDTFVGLAASLILCCTETVFYTLSVYFMAAKVKKTRWTLPGALLATVAGIVASVVLARWM